MEFYYSTVVGVFVGVVAYFLGVSADYSIAIGVIAGVFTYSVNQEDSNG